MSAPGPAHADEGVATRRLALEVLTRVDEDGAYANLALGPVLARSGLDERDRGLVTDLSYGTLRRRRAMEYLVDRFLSEPPPPSARRALLLGAYQLKHRPDIPVYASVSATVGAAPKRYRGLVNAVLRRVSQAPAEYPDEATRLSYPTWVLDLLSEDLGRERAVAALEAMNGPATTHIRPDGYVQDLASQWVVDALLAAVSPPVRVVDLCSSPGGKATGLGAAEGVSVMAMDRSSTRIELVASNLDRLGSRSVVPLLGDAVNPPLRSGVSDVVLLDAPCSGLGVLRRRADARWRLTADTPDRLAELQRSMVDAAVDLLAPGAVLMYSVCTLSAVETLGIDEHMAARHPSLVPLEPPGDPWEPWGRGAILLPQTRGTDGMALFCYRRT